MNHTSTNILSLLGADSVNKLIGFISITFLARTYGPETIGILAAGMGFLSYFNIIAEAGLPILGTRKVAGSNRVSVTLINRLVNTRLFLSGCLFLVSTTILFFSLEDSRLRNITIIYLLSLFPCSLLLEWLFHGLKKMIFLSWGRILSSSVYILWLLVFVRSDSSLILVPIGWILGITSQAIYLWRKSLPYQMLSKANLGSSLDLIKLSLPFGLAGLIAQSVTQFPIIYLGITNPQEGGLFSIAFRVIMLILVIDRVFYTLFFPSITSVIKQDYKKLDIYFPRILKIVATSATYLGIMALISSKELLPLFFGKEFIESIIIFQLLVVYFIFSLVNSVFTFTLIGAKKEIVYLKSLFLGSVGFFAIMLLPGPFPLSHLASIGLVLFQLISLFVMLREVQSFINFSVVNTILIPLFIGIAIMILLATFYTSFPGFSFFIAFIVSPIILYYTVGITQEDKKYALKAIS
ncbi:MAG: hypothetical protein CMG75_03270 [Candidatus Marinimicrobia bacterium]|nr:hypothetical protein [Candidatus Neomarinimicrobiota bacterium]|tara:strand:+ start:14439 stop:15833 length:1395 start_codon:yes stop_codon:yes gene_type:complete